MKIKEGTEKLFGVFEVDGVKYNGYTSIVITIAAEWAERMEECIEAGQTVAECALQTMEAGTMGVGVDKWWYTVAIGFFGCDMDSWRGFSGLEQCTILCNGMSTEIGRP